MSCPFPPEILDLIVGHLHDEPATLKTCCVVSKSWIPRARRHLFASIEFSPQGPTVGSWMKTFPDPSTSPADYTCTLKVLDIWAATAASHWLRAFRQVVRLHMVTLATDEDQISLVPFHGLWPALRSLRLGFDSIPPSKVFDFMCSFPLLEDLMLFHIGHENTSDIWITPSTSPKLTGSLDLGAMWGIWPTARRLLDLPNGLHFTRIALVCVHGADLDSTTDLVSECSDTLEYLSVTCNFPGMHHWPLFLIDTSYLHSVPSTSSFNLSAATKLKDLTFQCTRPGVRWITAALQTTESKALQRIALYPEDAALDPSDGKYQEWQDLDRLLLQFWTSHSIRPRVVYEPDEEGVDLTDLAPILFPELFRRRLIDLVERPS